MGGVNHCSLHCLLAKFRGLMINAEYSAVIGQKKTQREIVTGHIQKDAFLGQSQRGILR